MMRPHIAFLLKLLKSKGVESFDAIYSQPASYKDREHTKFSSGSVSDVREIIGFAGLNTPAGEELLIVAPGFDDALLREVVAHKDRAKRVQIFTLPSLQPDMYQHNVLKAYGADTPIPQETPHTRRFASAADPFAVAAELSAIVEFHSLSAPNARIYIAPLATKAQMLGAALFYVTECENRSISLIYPIVARHEAGTSTGLSRIWVNTIDFRLSAAISR